MRGHSTIQVARIHGVDLKIHISLMLLLPYLIFVTAVRFPEIVQASGIPYELVSHRPWLWGAGFAAALLVSIVAHEFGHVLTAQRLGIQASSITLMMLGGVSRLEPGENQEKRYSEFKLSLVGPLVSVVLSGILFALYRASPAPNFKLFCYWLGSVNLALAIFNLLPAFPLDGGRALRSVLAAQRGMVRATQISVRISKVFSWVLGVWGLLTFNIVLMLIAFFIYSAAQTELFFLLTRSFLRGLRAEEVYLKTPAVHEKQSLADAANAMLESNQTSLPVTSDHSPDTPFLVTLSQVKRVPRDFWDITKVKDVMDQAPRFVEVDELIANIIGELASSHHQILPVRHFRQLVGVLRFGDVAEILQLKSLAEDKEIDVSQKPAA